jgi:MFS family permease
MSSYRKHGQVPAGSGWYLVFVVVLLVLLSYVDRAVLTLFGSHVQASYDLSDSQMGVLYGLAFIVPVGLATILVGWAVDRFNRVVIVLAGLLLWSLSTAACGLADSYLTLLVARGGVGLGEAALAPAAYALIGDRFPPHRRGRAMGIVTAAVSVGTGAALVVGGVLLRWIGPDPIHLPVVGTVQDWQAVFLLLGLAGLPLAVLVLTLRDYRPSATGAGGSNTAISWRFLARFRAVFVAIFAAGALNVAVGTGVVTWTPTLLLRQFSYQPGDAGLLLGVMSILGGLLGAPLAAELSDRWVARKAVGGRMRGHAIFFSSLLLGTVVLAMGPNVYVAASGLLLVALALGAINSLSYASIQDLAPAMMRGKLLAALQFITLACGYGVGPSLVAFFSDHVFKGQGALGIAFLCVGVPLCLVGIFGTLLARRAYLPAMQAASTGELVAESPDG